MPDNGAYVGLPVHTSPLIPEGQVMRIGGTLWFHSRISARGRMRRRHGRPRNHPRRLKVQLVRYQPELDRVRGATKGPGR